MKKLFMVLAIASMFIASTAFAAVLTMTMPTNNAQAGPPVTAAFNFTVETDGAGNITAFTDFLSNYFYAATQAVTPYGTFPIGAGGYDPRDGGVFQPGEQIYPNGVKQFTSTAFDGNTAGTTLWFKGQSNTAGTFGGAVFDVGLLNIVYDPITDVGLMNFGPNTSLQEGYAFTSAVPIPGAAWLLLSGLVGIIGLRRRS